MAIALSLENFPYVLKADRKKPVEEQTTFFLKVLLASHTATIEDSIRFAHRFKKPKPGQKNEKKKPEDEEEEVELIEATKKGTAVISTLKRGLMGWDNFPDPKGEQVAFKNSDASKCHDSNINRIPSNDRHELAEAIEKGNAITEDEEKNSESVPGSEQEK